MKAMQAGCAPMPCRGMLQQPRVHVRCATPFASVQRCLSFSLRRGSVQIASSSGRGPGPDSDPFTNLFASPMFRSEVVLKEFDRCAPAGRPFMRQRVRPCWNVAQSAPGRCAAALLPRCSAFNHGNCNSLRPDSKSRLSWSDGGMTLAGAGFTACQSSPPFVQQSPYAQPCPHLPHSAVTITPYCFSWHIIVLHVCDFDVHCFAHLWPPMSDRYSFCFATHRSPFPHIATRPAA